MSILFGGRKSTLRTTGKRFRTDHVSKVCLFCFYFVRGWFDFGTNDGDAAPSRG